jgi:predicted nucleic acid-binding protein
MKHVFLDTNILIDASLDSRPYHHAAKIIFQAVHNKKIVAYTSTQSLLDLNYILTKGNKSHVKGIGAMMQKLCNDLIVCDTLRHHILMAAKYYYDDFEDAVQTSIAIDNCCDMIISGDKGFDGTFGPPVVSPDEFCREYFEE